MSKLAENIQTTITNKRAISNNYDFTFTYEQSNIKPSLLYQVRFDAVFGVRYYIDEKQCYKNSDVLALTLTNVKRQVVEEIFGEFRKPLMELRHNLYDRKIDISLELLSKLEKQMFDV